MSVRSFSDCNITAIQAQDPECIYFMKLLLCHSVTYLTPLSSPTIFLPLFVNLGIWLPKNEHKGRHAKNGGKLILREGGKNAWNEKICFVKTSIKKSLIKKHVNNIIFQILRKISTFYLLIRTTGVAIFS